VDNSLNLTELDWRQLEQSRVWHDVLLPFIGECEKRTLLLLQEAGGNTGEYMALVGRLQAYAQIRNAPVEFIARLLEIEKITGPPEEEANARRRDSLYERFRRGLRS
jgi:hypothetical protein